MTDLLDGPVDKIRCQVSNSTDVDGGEQLIEARPPADRMRRLGVPMIQLPKMRSMFEIPSIMLGADGRWNGHVSW